MSKHIILIIIGTILSIVFGIAGLVYWMQSTTDTSEASHLQRASIQYNFLVLLDLSDRISPSKHPHQAKKDIAILQSLMDIFDEQVKKKLYLSSEDKIQILIAPQPVSYSSLFLEIGDKLFIDMERLSLREKTKQFEQLKSEFLESVNRLYTKALQSSDFLGADIWTFFKDDLENYLYKDQHVKNVLIILTDGYLQFEKSILDERPRNKNRTSYMLRDEFLEDPEKLAQFDEQDYGFISFEKDFNNLEVIVLEIHIQDMLNPIEYELIEKYWYKWFHELGVSKSRIVKSQNSSAQVKRIIEGFIFSEEKS